jgi:glycerophosphoryl diester phosphodiesterase
MWIIIWLAVVFLCIGILVALRLVMLEPHPPRAFLQRTRPLAFAHQGGAKLAPANTLPAFHEAHDLGCDVLELDVHGTADGEIVVIHDDTVDRTTDGTGRVKDLTLAQLQALDAGYRFSPYGAHHPYRGKGVTIPTLREILEAFPGARLNIEIKQAEPPIEEALVSLIREMDAADRVLVASVHDGVLQRFRRLEPGVATSASEKEVYMFVIGAWLHLTPLLDPAFDALQVPPRSGSIPVVTRDVVEAAHSKNIQVHVWTIDEEAEMRRLLDLDVDAIMSDQPDLLMQILGEAGYWVETEVY